jgi:hypothetical protein
MTSGGDRARQWDAARELRDATETSWYEPVPRTSMELIRRAGLSVDLPVIDVGGGESLLVDNLLAGGFCDLTVLDVSGQALAAVRRRVGDNKVRLLLTDVLDWQPERRYALWHDRAVFHFLVDQVERDTYLSVLDAGTEPGSALVIGSFAADGPTSCSGLPVARYSCPELAAVFEPSFDVVSGAETEHTTPVGGVQPFTWIVARRR